MTARELLKQLTGEYASVRQRLDELQTDPQIRQFPASLPARRAQIIAPWRKEVGARVVEWQRSELPAMQTERRAARELGLQKIARGLSPTFKAPAERQLPAEHLEPLAHDRWIAERRHATMAQKLDALHTEMQRVTTLRLLELASSEDLAERLQTFRAAARIDERQVDAEKTLRDFDFPGWAVARELLGAVLKHRAATGDPRADFAMRQIPQVDERLLALAGLTEQAVAVPEAKNLEDVREVVTRLDDTGGPVLAELDSLMSGLTRALDRSESAELAGAAGG